MTTRLDAWRADTFGRCPYCNAVLTEMTSTELGPCCGAQKCLDRQYATTDPRMAAGEDDDAQYERRRDTELLDRMEDQP